MKTKKPTVYYVVNTTDLREKYPSTSVRFFEGKATPLSERIAGCVGNAAGYGSDEAAERVLANTVVLRDVGYTHLVESAEYSGRRSSTASYQHYGADEFCDATWNVGHNLDEIVKNVAFAARVTGKLGNPRAAIQSPAGLIACLEACKAVRVEYAGSADLVLCLPLLARPDVYSLVD